jgi:hypothetical protein
MISQPAHRRYERHTWRKPIVLVLEGNEAIKGSTTDIAEGGLGAEISKLIQPGQKVTLAFDTVSGGSAIMLRAIVRYQIGSFHGFEFVSVGPNPLNLLKQLCDAAAAS